MNCSPFSRLWPYSMLVGSLWNTEDCPLVCVNHRWSWLPLSDLLFRPLLKPAGFPYTLSHRMDKAGRGLSGIIWSNLSAQATLVGGYAVVISWEGVEIDDYPGTALLRPVFATMTRRRQKARETDSLSQHFYKIYRAAGCPPKCRWHEGKKIVPSSGLCTKQDGPLRPRFQSKVVQKTKGKTQWSMKCCMSLST